MRPLRAHRTVPLSQCGVFPGKVRDDGTLNMRSVQFDDHYRVASKFQGD